MKDWPIWIWCVEERVEFKFGRSAVNGNLPDSTVSSKGNVCSDSLASHWMWNLSTPSPPLWYYKIHMHAWSGRECAIQHCWITCNQHTRIFPNIKSFALVSVSWSFHSWNVINISVIILGSFVNPFCSYEYICF